MKPADPSAPAPHFLGIGAQKAGTAWLYENLRAHPEIWLTPKKEIHYFDDLQNYPGAGRITTMRIPRWRKQIRERIPDALRRLDLAALRWDLHYFFGRRDDAWYRRLFAPGAGKVCGEITPAYSTLDRSHVEHVRAVAPHVRCILLLRDPIERAWSAALMNLRKGRSVLAAAEGDIARVPDDTFIEYLRNPAVTARGDYLSTLENWGAAFPAEQLMIGFNEDLAERPRAFLRELFAFVGVDADERHVPAAAAQRVHVGGGEPMPAAVDAFLRAHYTPEIEKLAARLQQQGHAGVRYAERWLAGAEPVR